MVAAAAPALASEFIAAVTKDWVIIYIAKVLANDFSECSEIWTTLLICLQEQDTTN